MSHTLLKQRLRSMVLTKNSSFYVNRNQSYDHVKPMAMLIPESWKQGLVTRSTGYEKIENYEFVVV